MMDLVCLLTSSLDPSEDLGPLIHPGNILFMSPPYSKSTLETVSPETADAIGHILQERRARRIIFT